MQSTHEEQASFATSPNDLKAGMSGAVLPQESWKHGAGGSQQGHVVLWDRRKILKGFIKSEWRICNGNHDRNPHRIPTLHRRSAEGGERRNHGRRSFERSHREIPCPLRHVRDDQGQIRQFLNVYLNEEDIRFLGGEGCTLKDGDRVLLVPSIAGG